MRLLRWWSLFDRHPNTVVPPIACPPLIHSLPQRLRTIGSLGADALLLLHFDRAFSEQPGEVFIRGSRARSWADPKCLRRRQLRFSHKRAGNVELLKKLGEELNFTVHGMATVSLDGQRLSSTRIREGDHASHP